MSTAEIILERETANDESALIVSVLVQSGSAVEEDQLLFETENSKATQEVRAPHAGILTHSLQVGQTVEFGIPIAHVVPVGEVSSTPSKSVPVAARPAASRPESERSGQSYAGAGNGSAASHTGGENLLAREGITRNGRVETSAATSNFHGAPQELAVNSSPRLPEPRFSRAAAALLDEHGLSRTVFNADFVTTADVRAHLGLSAAPHAPLAPPREQLRAGLDANPKAALPGGRAIPGRKRAEIESLSKGAGESMLSVLGISLGPLSVDREPGDFLNGRITDLVLYESARLMRKFPRLNAYFAEGQIFTREFVHAGLAIDSGERLVVYGIENADQLSLRDLSETMADAVGRYMDDQLTAAEMTRATYTVTDLSGDELDFVFPLLPRGQTLILGVTHSAQGGYRLFAGFDHRVTEGREVGIFLGELRERLLSFASTTATVSPSKNCEYCDRSVREAVVRGNEKGLLKVVGLDGREVLCCASCWNGW